MNMSLTKQDLAAIKKIVNDRLDESDQITAVAFNDVYGRLDGLTTRLSNVETGLLNLRFDVGSLQSAVGRVETTQQNMVN